MKDESIADLEMNLPSTEGNAAVETCLQALYDDKTHRMTDEFAPHVTYGELIDALLAARDNLDHLRELEAEAVNEEFWGEYGDDEWTEVDKRSMGAK